MAQLGNLIVNGVTRLLSKVYVSDSVTAPKFIGALQGNADTATKVTTVDSVLNSTSTNPIQNKAVNEALADRYKMMVIKDSNNDNAYYFEKLTKVNQSLSIDVNERLSNLPVNMDYARAVIYNNEIHLVGGENYGDEIKHYKYNGSVWTVASTIPSTCTVVDDYFFFVYSNDLHLICKLDDFSYVLLKYNDGNWNDVFDVPTTITNIRSVAVYNNKIYLFTGTTNSGVSYAIYNGSSLSDIIATPFKALKPSAVVYKNKIYLFFVNDANWNNKVGIIDDSGITSVEGTDGIVDMNSNVNDCPIAVYNNEVHLIGGNGDGGSPHDYHYKFDGSAWTQMPNIFHEFYQGAAITYNNELHLIGGTYCEYGESINDQKKRHYVLSKCLDYYYEDSSNAGLNLLQIESFDASTGTLKTRSI